MTAENNQQTPSAPQPFKPHKIPMCRPEIVKRFPDAMEAQVNALGTIWDEVIHHIVQKVVTLSRADPEPLHINIREDMILELAKLQYWLAGLIIDKRTDGCSFADIDPQVERYACLGPEGADTITGTALVVYERIWKRKMDERWKPKSAKASEREKNPRAPTLAVKPVGKNHFIPRWFIRDLWAIEGQVQRWRRTETGWSSARRGFGEWGYRHNLYSDRLEAYLALVEGDAKRPIEMLLDTRPLNGLQRHALVGFLIVQMLRNPFFIDAVQREIGPLIAREGYADDLLTANNAFESTFRNNGFYDEISRPVMWSRWAVVRSEAPLFVLPDTFGVRGDFGDGLRMLVPLTPRTCFVTLPDREEEKRVVPAFLPANERLARRISATLIQETGKEFVSHPDFVPDETPAPTFRDLLIDIAKAIALRDDDEP